MDKQEAYKFIADNIRVRPLTEDGVMDGCYNFIHRTKAIMLVDKIFEHASQQAVALDADGRCVHCGAGDEIHHSFTCPTGLHPDRRK